MEVTKLVQSEELQQKLLIGKFLIKLNTAIKAHKWFDGDNQFTFNDYNETSIATSTSTTSTSVNLERNSSPSHDLPLEDPNFYNSIQSVSSLLLHDRPGTVSLSLSLPFPSLT